MNNDPMPDDFKYSFALTRGVPDTYDRCIRSGSEPIDIRLAKEQHDKYCLMLASLALDLIRLEPENRYPDCCFVEDPAVVFGDAAVICRMGAASRSGEEAAVETVLKHHREIFLIQPPGTLEGGDVLMIGKKLFVGLSRRTNQSGFEQLKAIARKMGYEAIAVDCKKLVHLKSDCTYLGDCHILARVERFDIEPFAGFKIIPVPANEGYAANCLSVNGKVLVSKGYPKTIEKIGKAGFKSVALDMSEFRKGEGSLTCLSKIL